MQTNMDSQGNLTTHGLKVALRDERIADLLNEAAVLRSLMRVPTVDAGKAEVLKAAGRPVQAAPDNCRKMSDVFEAMRKAAQ